VCLNCERRHSQPISPSKHIFPPLADDRLRRLGAGRVRVELKRAWRDGTTHLLFEPLDLLEKLAALTPRPEINVVLYHGVLAPHARWRPGVVAYPRARSRRGADPNATTSGARAGAEPAREKPRYGTWAALMRRAFDIDGLRCPHCAGRMRLIATIEDPAGIARILAQLGLSGSRDGPGPAPPTAAPPAEPDALPHATI